MKIHKKMTNLELAKLFGAIAAAYEVRDGRLPNKQFRVIAYERAADSFEHLTSEVRDLWKQGELDEIPGLGKSMIGYLDELFKTGSVRHFEKLMKDLPPAMFEFLPLAGVGAKTAYRLAKELKIKTAKGALEKLEQAGKQGKIAKMEGFGEQSEKDILEAVAEVAGKTRRHLLPYASEIADNVVAWLKKEKSVKQVHPLGSLRRQVATVGDIDIAVASEEPGRVIEHFKKYPVRQRVIEAGERTSSILLPGEVQVDLMVQPPGAYGALLQHFTGSKHHNVALRLYAQRKGLSLSEYGIKKLKVESEKVKTYKTEEEFYRVLGLEWIPPEIREDRGEIEASLNGKLPKLVELSDIKGDLHLHSNFPSENTAHDVGADSMEVMVEKASSLGYEYILFTEHNLKSDLPEREVLEVMKKKQEMVVRLNEKCEKREKGVKRVFNGLEVDIRPDGSLALPEKAFDYLDFVVASVHSSFRGSAALQTKRVLAGLSHPKVKILGHPTGRKLNERAGMDLDWAKIFDFCRKNNKWLEINSYPDRLDLPDNVVYEAVQAGVRMVISTDAHAVDQMDMMRYGVAVARRGWATRRDIVNTLSLEKFLKLLKT